MLESNWLHGRTSPTTARHLYCSSNTRLPETLLQGANYPCCRHRRNDGARSWPEYVGRQAVAESSVLCSNIAESNVEQQLPMFD